MCVPPSSHLELHPAVTSGRATLLEERAAVGRAWKASWCGLRRSLLKVGVGDLTTPTLREKVWRRCCGRRWGHYTGGVTATD